MSTVNLDCIAEEPILINTAELVIVENYSAKKKKSRAFTDKENRILIAEWFKYPQLYNKRVNEYHDRDKRVLARQEMALAVNQAMGYEDNVNEENKVTGIKL